MNTPRINFTTSSQEISFNMIISVPMVVVMTLLSWKSDDFNFLWEYFLLFHIMFNGSGYMKPIPSMLYPPSFNSMDLIVLFTSLN